MPAHQGKYNTQRPEAASQANMMGGVDLARCFERVYMSIKDHLIGAQGCSADVFFFLGNGDTSPRGGFAGLLPVDRTIAMTDYLGAVKVEFQEHDLAAASKEYVGGISVLTA